DPKNPPPLPPGFVPDAVSAPAAPITPSAPIPPPAGFVLDQPTAPEAPEITMRPNNVLPARYQPFETSMGPFQAKSGLGDLFVNSAKDAARQAYEFSGNTIDAVANQRDALIGSLSLSLAKMFYGEDELNKRAMAAEPTLSAP